MKKTILTALALAFLFVAGTQAQTSITSGGLIVRGSGTNMANETFIIPMDGEQGSLSGPSVTKLYTNIVGAPVTNIYHLNGSSSLSQNVLTNRYLITNAAEASLIIIHNHLVK